MVAQASRWPWVLAGVLPALAGLGCSDDDVGSAAVGSDAGGARDGAGDALRAPEADRSELDAAARPVDATSDAAKEASAALAGTLSTTGLYADIASETLADGVRPFAPRFQLWSDGATKRRWLYLPRGAPIDATDPDGWVFPVGTKAWKEFTRDGVRVETRLLEKTEAGWEAVAYVWNADGTDAVATPAGLVDARGTEHDVPKQSDCFACHSGSADMLLGVGAIQMAAADGLDAGPSAAVTLAVLASEGSLEPPPVEAVLSLPGSAIDQAALGRLHVDCGHCHRPGTLAWERAEMDLHLDVDGLGSLAETAVFRTAVGVPTARTIDGAALRIAPGAPDASAIYVRMTSRDSVLGMPTVGTERVDAEGSSVVRDWIATLSPDAGALDAGPDAAEAGP